MANSDKSIRVYADFNGLFGDLLCLSHEETCVDESGAVLQLSPGMNLTAFQDELVASGIVERSPDWLQCRGSKWALRIDKDGVRTVPEPKKDA